MVARIHFLRVGRAGAQLDARHRGDLLLDRLEVRLGVVAGGDLVAALAELHLRRAGVRRAGGLVGRTALGVAERRANLRLRRLVDDADVLHADEKLVARCVAVGDDLRRGEAGRLDGAANGGRVHRLGEGDLHLGAAAEVRPVVRPGVEAQHHRDEHEEERQGDPESPLSHEVDLLGALEEFHRSFGLSSGLRTRRRRRGA